MTLSDIDRNTIAHIEEHGWSSMHVMAEGDDPSFTYSIGFWETLNAPDAIIFGMPRKLAHSMLWRVFEQIRDGKAALQDHARWTDVIADFDCISRPVHQTQIGEYLNFAIWYREYRTQLRDLAAYQIFWPGKPQGLFPWETGCEQIVRDCQPLLYLPRMTGLA